jgi:hypothetical protein
MTVVPLFVWGEAVLLAATFGFGLASRLGAIERTAVMRNVHFVLAAAAAIGMIITAMVVGAVAR